MNKCHTRCQNAKKFVSFFNGPLKPFCKTGFKGYEFNNLLPVHESLLFFKYK